MKRKEGFSFDEKDLVHPLGQWIRTHLLVLCVGKPREWEGDQAMAGNRSFTDCVQSRFHNELYSAIENYVEENLDSLALNLRKVWNVGQISLTDMKSNSYLPMIPVVLIVAGAAISAKGLVHVRSHRREAATESDDEGKR